MYNFDKLSKIYEDIIEAEIRCDHWNLVSKIMHWFQSPDYLNVFSAGEFLVEENKWEFQLPKYKEVENADGMIHLHTCFLKKGAKDWDEVEEKDLTLDPQSITDMRIFLSFISTEIKIRNDWSLVYEHRAS